MILLGDGDIFAHRIGYAKKLQSLEDNLLGVDTLIRDILSETGADEYKIFLSGGPTFRHEINPEYKANRKDMERPPYLQEIREFLVTEWSAVVCDGIEADDALGINQTNDSFICSLDKDLLQIPGMHYNFVKKEWRQVDPWDGLKFFYEQLLVGDTVDNIFGIYGIGPKKAQKALQWCESEAELFEVVRDLYNDDARLLMNGRCLKIQTTEGELWQFPSVEQPEQTDEKTCILISPN